MKANNNINTTRNIEYISVVIFFLISLSYFIYLGNISIIFFLFLFNLIILGYKKKIENLFILNFGILFSIIIFNYWNLFYGEHYFNGALSDDYNYDVYWTKGYYQRYGLSPLHLLKHMYILTGGGGINHNSFGYVYFIILLRYFGDLIHEYHSFLPILFNVFFLVLISIYSSKISENLFNNEYARKTIKYSCFFFPIMLFNATHIFRDTLVSLILVYSFYGILMYKKNILFIIYFVFLFILLFNLRKANVVFLLLTSALLFLNRDYVKRNFKFFLISFTFISLLLFLVFNDYIFTYLDKYSDMNQERFSGLGGKFFALPMPIGIIPRLVFLIFVPAIGIGSIHQIFLSISTFIQIFIFPILIFSLLNQKIDIRLKITFMLYFMGIALSTATFRHVMMYIPFAIILISNELVINKFSINSKYLLVLSILFTVFTFSTIIALLY